MSTIAIKSSAEAKPIAFAPAMLAAILAGRKTQTRRPVKVPAHWVLQHSKFMRSEGRLHRWFGSEESVACPYGKPGDMLYVKERWRYEMIDADDVEVGLRYQSDGLLIPAPDPESKRITNAIFEASEERDVRAISRGDESKDGQLWTPWHVHLPKWAARTFLRVESVRVERLQEICELECYAEGIAKPSGGGDFDVENVIAGFEKLWDSHARDEQYLWAANPWVWVVGFERVEMPAAPAESRR